MIKPELAIWIVVGFLILFGCLLPILNIKFEKYISMRWMCVVVVLALLIGVVVDFSDLDNDSRHIVLIGGLIVSGGYVLLRSIEKALFNGWIGKGKIKLTAEKGDLKGTVEIDSEDKSK